MADRRSTTAAGSIESRIAAILADPENRAVFVSIEDRIPLDGQPDFPSGYRVSPVGLRESVINIERDLLEYLNDRPCSDEWLEVLRDYCDGRIKARAAARANRSIVVPNWRSDWNMVSLAAARGEAAEPPGDEARGPVDKPAAPQHRQ